MGLTLVKEELCKRVIALYISSNNIKYTVQIASTGAMIKIDALHNSRQIVSRHAICGS